MRAVVFDMSRLWLASLRDTPRGIERVDVTFASQLCREWEGDVFGLSWTPWGLRLFDRGRLEALLAYVTRRWSERSVPEDDPIYRNLRAWLPGNEPHVPTQPEPEFVHRLSKLRTGASCLSAVGLAMGREPVRALPHGAIYLNVGHVGFAAPGMDRLLASRPDLKIVALIHDTISLTDPQFFPDRNLSYFEAVFARIVRHADLILSTTAVGLKDIADLLEKAGADADRVAAIDMDAVFDHMPETDFDASLREQPYFVVCGTREPRKNHLTLLNIWRRLAAMPRPPKLAIVGGQGWGTEDVTDMLERCEPIRTLVARVERLQSPGLFTLIRNARALLAPSLAEGFGLPVVEALRLGSPVLASDIPVFRETTRGMATLIDPLDGLVWKQRIAALTEQPASPSSLQEQRSRQFLGSASPMPALYDLLRQV